MKYLFFFLFLFPSVAQSTCNYDFTGDYVDCNCQQIPFEIQLYQDKVPLRLYGLTNNCLNEVYPGFDNYYFRYITSCTGLADCSYQVGLWSEDFVDLPPFTTSFLGFDNSQNGLAYYVGVVAYYCEPWTMETCGGSGMLYQVWGTYGCPIPYIKRTNDQMTVNAVNQEVYSFNYNYRGNVYSYSNADVIRQQWVGPDYWNYAYTDYMGVLYGSFTRDSFFQQFGKGGHVQFKTNITGTQCGDYYLQRYIGQPGFWFDCEAGTIGEGCFTCDESGCSYRCTYEGENWFGFDMWGDLQNWDDYLGVNEMDTWQIWRWPVNKQFQAVGPMELYKDVAAGFPDWGYITSPGGSDLDTDVNIEKGFKYRFRSVVDEFIYQYDISAFPCSEVRSEGNAVANHGSGALNKGMGVKSRGMGGHETNH